MREPHRLTILLLACVTLVMMVGAPRVAFSCDPPVRDLPNLVTTRVPAGGMLLFVVHCLDCDAPGEDTIAVYSEDGSELEGTFVESGAVINALERQRWAFWAPLEPFSRGRYSVVSKPVGFVPVREVVADSVPLPGLQELGIEAELTTVATGVGRESCCEMGPLDSCGRPTCFFDETLRRARLRLTPQLVDDELATQLLYRVAWSSGLEPRLSDWTTSTDLRTVFDRASNDYCYTLEARLPGSHGVGEIRTACVAYSDPDSLGRFATDPLQINEVLDRCDVPPAGYQSDGQLSDGNGPASEGCQTGSSVAWWLAIGLLSRRTRSKQSFGRQLEPDAARRRH